MRKDFGAKTWLYPMPVFIIGTYDNDGVPNAMNAAWGGTYDYETIMIVLSSHKTTDNLALKKAFTVSIGTKDTEEACDYVGIASGRKVLDKVSRAGWHHHKASHVDAPLFDELPFALECEMLSFENGTLIGKIVNVSVDERVLTNGKPDPKKIQPIVFDPINNKYLLSVEEVGSAYKDGLKIK